MSPYQIHILLEALVKDFTLHELEDTERVVPLVAVACKLSLESSHAIVEGAQDLKAVREGAKKITPKRRQIYLQ